MHADDQEIEKPVRIEVGDRVRHACGVRLVEPMGRDVGEMTVSVILVQVGSAEIAHNHQVRTAVVIEVHQ